MSVLGLILSNLHDGDLSLLTARRTMGAVPFGGRYRLIDFPLSALVAAGVRDVRVIAHRNYHSLMEHIGSGKDWGLARHTGGVTVLPPYSIAYANPVENYSTRMRSLMSIRGLFDRVEADTVLCLECDAVSVPDLTTFLAAHKASGRPMTIGTRNDTPLHVFAAQTAFLREQLKTAESAHYTSFWLDVVERQKEKGNVATYAFRNRFFLLRSMADYYELHMRLVREPDVLAELLQNPERPVLTKERYAPPVKYGENAAVENALIADGCVVEGSVRDAVLFPGVRVGRDCVVENAVLMRDCVLTGRVRFSTGVVGRGACLYDRVELHGHPALPLFVDEQSILH